MPDMNMMNTPRPNPDDREAAMARADLYKLANYSTKLFKMIQDGDQLEGWVQAKITKSADYIASVYHFMEYEMKFSEYGERLETADMYSESVKREFKRKLTEAKVKLEKLKEKNQKDLDEGWEDMMAANKKAASEKGTGKFDKKTTSTGTQYTRKSSTFSDGGDDKDTKKAKAKAKKTNEGIKDIAKKAMGAVKKAGSKALDTLGHGSDEDLIKGMQKKAGMPQTGKKPMAVKNEAAKPDFLDMDKDGNKKEPMKKAVADKKTTEALKGGQRKLDVDKDGKLEKSDFEKLRASKGVKEAEQKTMSRAAKGHEKYGKEGMQALAKAGKEGKSLDPVRKKYDKYDEAAKPDFLDMDKDGNKKEPMKKAVADKKKNPFAKK
jgi:hypothetical protein